MLPILQCILQASGKETCQSSHIFQNESIWEVNVVFFMEEVKKYDCFYNKYNKSYKSGQVY